MQAVKRVSAGNLSIQVYIWGKTKMDISYDYYRTFYYVAKYKSFTGAAEALLNSQPNITRTMKKLEKELIRLADQRQLNVIFTTGGTGFSERDRTPEATVNVCDRMANGIAEAIRNYSMTITKRAMFSRAVSGIRKKTLIINLPGSPKAVQEALEFLLPELGHGLGILRGTEGECARK